MMYMYYFYNSLEKIVSASKSLPLFAENPRTLSRKLVVASLATNIATYSVQNSVTPCSCCRDIATATARICYEELQVVTDQLPENKSCVAMQGFLDQRTTQNDFC
jgi:hypothetical protein